MRRSKLVQSCYYNIVQSMLYGPMKVGVIDEITRTRAPVAKEQCFAQCYLLQVDRCFDVVIMKCLGISLPLERKPVPLLSSRASLPQARPKK